MSILRHIQEKDLTLHISDGNMHVKHFFSCLFTSYSSSLEAAMLIPCICYGNRDWLIIGS